MEQGGHGASLTARKSKPHLEMGTEQSICRVKLQGGTRREAKGSQLNPPGSQQLPIFYLLLFLRFFSLFSSPRGELGFTASPKRDFVMSNAAWQKKLS